MRTISPRPAPLVARYGAEIVTVGDTMTALSAENGQAWDAMVLRH